LDKLGNLGFEVPARTWNGSSGKKGKEESGRFHDLLVLLLSLAGDPAPFSGIGDLIRGGRKKGGKLRKSRQRGRNYTNRSK
jgi:hypothetical protein